MLTTYTIYGGYPFVSSQYEIGSVRNKIELTNTWYFFILAVAFMAVTNGSDIHSIKETNNARRTNKIVLSGTLVNHKPIINGASTKTGMEKRANNRNEK